MEAITLDLTWREILSCMAAVKCFFCVYWHDHMILLLYLVDMIHWLIFIPSTICGYNGKSQNHAGTLLSRLPALRTVRNNFLLFWSSLVCGICYSARMRWRQHAFCFTDFFLPPSPLFLFFHPSFFMSFICWRKSDICATNLITIWIRLIACLCFLLTWTSIP